MLELDQDNLRVAIDVAQHDHPYCAQCGAPTTILFRNGQLWLECSELSRPMSVLRRLLFGDHDTFHVVDLPDAVLAA